MADLAALILIGATAPAITLFCLIYGFTSPWYKTLIGRALFVSSTGLALLVDISLLYKWLGDNYFLRDLVRLSVYGFICAGAWLKLAAVVSEKWRARHGKRDRFDN
jgi:hypothetical protein